MAHGSRVDPSAQLGIITLSDMVDVRDFVGAITSLYGSPDWQAGFCVLWDVTAIRQLLLDPADIHRIVEEVSSRATRIGTGRTAIVVARDLDAMIARLITRLLESGPRQYRLFHDHALALAWLRGEEPSAPPDGAA